MKPRFVVRASTFEQELYKRPAAASPQIGDLVWVRYQGYWRPGWVEALKKVNMIVVLPFIAGTGRFRRLKHRRQTERIEGGDCSAKPRLRGETSKSDVKEQ